MKATVFGAGNIGRGLVGDVLDTAGYALTFIDVDPDTIERLEVHGGYELIAGDRRRVVPIERAILASDEAAVVDAVAHANVIATAVGGPVLGVVAPAIGAGLTTSQMTSVNVIACENTHPNSTALRGHIVDALGESAVEGVGFPNVVVDRIAPGDPSRLEVTVEEGFEFVVDAEAWAGEIPAGTPIVFTGNLDAYKKRKLWLVNGLHAIAAWLAVNRRHEYIHEAMEDDEIRGAVMSAGSAAADALGELTGEFDQTELEAYLARTLDRFANASLPDLAVRVARNPVVKLARDERVMGPALAAEERGLEIDGFAAGIAAAFALEDTRVAGASELRSAVAADGWASFVAEQGLEPNTRLFGELSNRMNYTHEERGSVVITEEVTISNPAGLHARPAAEIVEQASTIDAEVHIKKGERTANAKSIMSVLALGANTGDTVTIVAEGSAAESAVAVIRNIMQSEEH